MKILIVGNIGLISYKLATSFHSNGHKVFLAGKSILNSGNMFKNFTYINSFDLDYVFKNNTFDLTIFIDELSFKNINKSSFQDKIIDNKSILEKLLLLSDKNNVKKLILYSSTEVYDLSKKAEYTETSILDPKTEKGKMYFSLESIVKTWSINSNMNTIIFRCSKIFNYTNDIVDIPFDFTSKDQQTGPFKINSGDYISIDSILKATNLIISKKVDGIFNITNNKILNNLILPKEVYASLSKKLYNSKPKSHELATICNKKLCSLIKWKPEQNICQVLKDMYSKNTNFIIHVNDFKNNTEPKQKSTIRTTQLLFSTLNLFLLVSFLFIFSRNFSTFEISYFGLFYFLIVAIFFDTIYFYLSFTLFSIFSFILSFKFSHIVNSQPFSVLIFKLLIFGLFSLTTSYIIRFFKSKLVIYKDELENIKQENGTLKNSIKILNDKNQSLENKILSSKYTYSKISYIVKKLNSLDSNSLFYESIDIFESLLNNTSIAVYLYDKKSDYFRIKSYSHKIKNNLQNNLKYSDLKESANFDVDIYISKNLTLKIPIISYPIIIDNQIIGLISLYKMDFELMTLDYMNLFRMSSEIVISTYEKLLKSNNFENKLSYYKNSKILNSNSYLDMCKFYKDVESKYKINFTVINISKILGLKSISQIQVFDKMNLIFRTCDYFGIDKNGDLNLLLPNTSEEYVETIKSRLQKFNFQIEGVAI